MFYYLLIILVIVCHIQSIEADNLTTWADYIKPVELQGFYTYQAFDLPVVQSIYSDEVDAMEEKDLTICSSKIKNARSQSDNGTRYVVDLAFKVKETESSGTCEALNLFVVAHLPIWGPLKVERRRFYEGKRLEFI
uniref:Cystatin domain-containing protein n=1 Tax=Panagrellus redivivus TaxID=6233 RepID=A0A7E4UXP9_PANRE